MLESLQVVLARRFSRDLARGQLELEGDGARAFALSHTNFDAAWVDPPWLRLATEAHLRETHMIDIHKLIFIL